MTIKDNVFFHPRRDMSPKENKIIIERRSAVRWVAGRPRGI